MAASPAGRSAARHAARAEMSCAAGSATGQQSQEAAIWSAASNACESAGLLVWNQQVLFARHACEGGWAAALAAEVKLCARPGALEV